VCGAWGSCPSCEFVAAVLGAFISIRIGLAGQVRSATNSITAYVGSLDEEGLRAFCGTVVSVYQSNAAEDRVGVSQLGDKCRSRTQYSRPCGANKGPPPADRPPADRLRSAVVPLLRTIDILLAQGCLAAVPDTPDLRYACPDPHWAEVETARHGVIALADAALHLMFES
jgi:hypothetical protein